MARWLRLRFEVVTSCGSVMRSSLSRRRRGWRCGGRRGRSGDRYISINLERNGKAIDGDDKVDVKNELRDNWWEK